jgi:hypothetical protein
MTEPVKPKGWMDRSVGNVKAFCRPGYGKILATVWQWQKPAAPRRPNLLGIIHQNASVATYPSLGKLAGLRVHSAARIDEVNLDLVEKARKTGVRVEKPLAIIYSPGENPLQVMQQIPGVTLAEFLKREKSPEKRRKVIADVFLQLKKLHANGMVHGDCHGNNFMVTPAGKVHIIDMNKRSPGYKPKSDFSSLKRRIKHLLRRGEWPKPEIIGI